MSTGGWGESGVSFEAFISSLLYNDKWGGRRLAIVLIFQLSKGGPPSQVATAAKTVTIGGKRFYVGVTQVAG